jgi:carbamate kinase
MTDKKNIVVVALGGNAILQPGQQGTFEEQLVNCDLAMRDIAEMVVDGYKVILTHGNGPQVGNILIQNEMGAGAVSAMPMDVCGAESQGQVGYMLEQRLINHLRRRGCQCPVVTIVTQTAVDADDPAFSNPTKPVGPFYIEERARELQLEQGFVMREDAGRGWRRVVPSPNPKEIVPLAAIVGLARDGALVICAGGGGIPVVRHASGALAGVAAVIDKDLGAALLAAGVGADVLMILTDISSVFVDYRGPDERALGHITLSEMEAHAAEGHFKAGSMGPKVEAALRFVRAGGTALIGSLNDAPLMLRGEAGTRIVPDVAASVGSSDGGAEYFDHRASAAGRRY